jgi:hypothetical protein
MNHITPEQAVALAESVNVASSPVDLSVRPAFLLSEARITDLCNAAIQHYIDSAALAQPVSEPAAVSGWRTIESAPKDGSWIIVTSTHNKYYRAAIQFLDGAWIDCNEESHDDFMDKSATHYMPKPPEPTGEPG